MSEFEWTVKRQNAAMLLAEGYIVEEVATQIGIADRTIYRWKNEPQFSEEVDRLTMMIGMANRAERLRFIKRMIRKLGLRTNRDSLEWIKLAQSETQGARIDLTDIIASIGEAGTSLAGSKPGGTESQADPEETETG